MLVLIVPMYLVLCTTRSLPERCAGLQDVVQLIQSLQDLLDEGTMKYIGQATLSYSRGELCLSRAEMLACDEKALVLPSGRSQGIC